MPTLNKHSRTAGHFPNLTPGEVGVNLADDYLWIRIDGKRVPLNLPVLRARAAPMGDQEGAPVVQASPRPKIDPALAPASVVAGAIRVDALPTGAYGVPGLLAASVASDIALAANEVRVEAFYVASDNIHVSALNVVGRATATLNLRVGIAASDGTILADVPMSAISAGANVNSVNVTLPRGDYYALLWTGTAVSVGAIGGYRHEQGWDAFNDGTPFFVASQRAIADLTTGLDMGPLSIEDVVLTSPGELRMVLMTWDLP